MAQTQLARSHFGLEDLSQLADSKRGILASLTESVKRASNLKLTGLVKTHDCDFP